MSFVVDPEGLGAHGRAIERTAAGAAADLARLRPGIEGGAAVPFGADAVYRELTALTGEALDLIRDAVIKTGGGLLRMAETFVDADVGPGRGSFAVPRNRRDARAPAGSVIRARARARTGSDRP